MDPCVYGKVKDKQLMWAKRSTLHSAVQLAKSPLIAGADIPKKDETKPPLYHRSFKVVVGNCSRASSLLRSTCVYLHHRSRLIDCSWGCCPLN